MTDKAFLKKVFVFYAMSKILDHSKTCYKHKKNYKSIITWGNDILYHYIHKIYVDYYIHIPLTSTNDNKLSQRYRRLNTWHAINYWNISKYRLRRDKLSEMSSPLCSAANLILHAAFGLGSRLLPSALRRSFEDRVKINVFSPSNGS